jgi:hypothetical protein
MKGGDFKAGIIHPHPNPTPLKGEGDPGRITIEEIAP